MKTVANYLFLKEDLEKLRAYRAKVNEKYVAAGKACGEACSQGAETYHDNAPYDMALREQGFYGNLLREVDPIIRQAKEIEPETHSGIIKIGSLVEVRDLTTNESYWIRVASFYVVNEIKNGTECDPIQVPYRSPLAQSIIGHKVDDEVDITAGRSSRKIKILQIK